MPYLKISSFLRPILLCCTLIVSGIGCNKRILEYTDPNAYNTGNYFTSPDQIREATNAIYVGFYFNKMMGFEWPELYDNLAYEVEPTPLALSNEPAMIQIRQYQYLNNNVVIEDYWKMLYRMILRANLAIDKGTEFLVKGKLDPNKSVAQNIGEAYFLRGWCYFQLAANWGRVPIRTSFNQVGNEDAPRAESVEKVWAVAENDFKKAVAALPESWNDQNLGRATRGAAIGFLGKLFLYTKRYDEAEKKFAELPNIYKLLPGNQWLDNFGEKNENNAESLFEVQFQWTDQNYQFPFFGSPEGNGNQPGTQTGRQQLYGWNDWQNWRFPESRVNDFHYKLQDNADYIDPRAALTFYGGIGDTTWLDYSTGGAIPYDFSLHRYWYKKILNKEYKEKENNAQTGNNLRLMRYADVILMRAECKMQKGELAQAIALINEVRTRVGAVNYTVPSSKEEVFKLLIRERQLELMGEQMRFNDLRRWGKLEEILNPESKKIFGTENIQKKHYLFPIPYAEILTNFGLGPVANEWN